MYSEFIENVPENMRKACLDEGQAHGLDITLITKTTVERIQNMMENSEDPNLLSGELSDLDKKKISSLEFLTYNQEQRGELLWQSNAMIRSFLAQRKVEAVKKVLISIPTDSIQLLVQFYGSKNNLPPQAECGICEHLAHQTYIAAIDGYNDWVEFFYNKKPKPPTALHGGNFTEKIASEHQEQIYQQDSARWKITLEEQTKITKDLFYNVLLFPERGWLVDPEIQMNFAAEEDVRSWEYRKVQLDNLRKLYIPDIVLQMHKMFTLSDDHKECMKLCDELANEHNQLYGVFSKHKMSELLTKIAESSLSLMNHKFDSFGFVAEN